MGKMDGRSRGAREIARLRQALSRAKSKSINAEEISHRLFRITERFSELFEAVDQVHRKNGDGSLKGVELLVLRQRAELEREFDSVCADGGFPHTKIASLGVLP